VELQQRIHEYQIQLLQLTQDEARLTEREVQLGRELETISAEIGVESERKAEAESRMEEAARLIEEAGHALAAAQQLHELASRALEEHRQLSSSLERQAQESTFLERECKGKIGEIERTSQSVTDQVAMAVDQIERLQAEIAGLQDESLKQQLQNLLEQRVGFEQILSEARTRQEGATTALREAEESKSGTEDKLQPLRDGIAEARLREQAARLSFDQFSVQLREAGVDDEGMLTLAGELRPGQKAAPLQTEINRLNNGIAELGAINMAALEELATSQERKAFLDSQAEDLNSALETLDNAIRRIDRETRDMLQNTFNTVNGHFSQMFPALFGGGEAHLLMSGEEILDAGVQVIARPPGKKNSTIHLLSGGEKALTAIALVFSFFQLNPAPFCLLDEVDAPLDDANTVRFCDLVSKMSAQTQFLYISHNKITMEMATHLVGVTMQERGVSRVVAVDIDEALQLREPVAA
jgi:chromosome segregation protein